MAEVRPLPDRHRHYSVALINHNTGEVVIAHRGTDADWGDLAEPAAMIGNPISTQIAKFFGIDLNPDGSDLDDDAVLAFGGVPAQFYDSRAFVDQVQKQMEQQGYGHYEFLHTGHSLGAFLADMHAAENDESHHRSITFDNPGARESLATLGVTYDPANHLSYQSHRNRINSINTQAGQEISIRLRTESDKFGIIRMNERSIFRFASVRMNACQDRRYRLTSVLDKSSPLNSKGSLVMRASA